jgi:hypothetical protein
MFGVRGFSAVFTAGAPGAEAVRVKSLTSGVVAANCGFLIDKSGSAARVKEPERWDFF